MIVTLEKPKHSPEAVWPGKCIAVYEVASASKNNCAKQVCFRFSVDTNEDKNIMERLFPADLTNGNQLYEFLDSWLDADFEWLPQDSDEINLACVVGEGGDVALANGHEIYAVYPHGTLL
jgi:hypothetical protein